MDGLGRTIPQNTSDLVDVLSMCELHLFDGVAVSQNGSVIDTETMGK